jgi:hypothetical protein
MFLVKVNHRAYMIAKIDLGHLYMRKENLSFINNYMIYEL